MTQVHGGNAARSVRRAASTTAFAYFVPGRRVVRSTGPDHDKRFHATVKVSKQIVGEGEGRSKKSAEQAAASAAFAFLTAT